MTRLRRLASIVRRPPALISEEGRYWLFIDQFLSSLTNQLPLVIGILAATDSTVAELAVTSAAATISVSVARDAIVVPMQLWGAKSLGSTFWRAVAVSVGLALTVAPVLSLARVPGTVTILGAVGCGLVVLFEVERGIELALNGGRRMAAADLFWCASSAFGCGLAVASDRVTTTTLLTSLFGPLLVLVPALWTQSASRVRWASYANQASWPRHGVSGLITNGLLGQTVGFMALGLNALLGPAVVAIWQTARIAYRPIGVLANLLPVIVPAKLANAPAATASTHAKRLSRRVTIAVAAMSVSLAPVGLALLYWRGVDKTVGLVWIVLVAVEFVTVVRFMVIQLGLFAVGDGRTAILLRVVVVISQGLGLFVAWLSGWGIAAQAIYVLGVAVVVVTPSPQLPRVRLSRAGKAP